MEGQTDHLQQVFFRTAASSFTGSLVARYSSSGNDTQTVIDFARNALKDGSTDDFIHQMKVQLRASR